MTHCVTAAQNMKTSGQFPSFFVHFCVQGVGEAVARLRDLGKQLIFVTNNSEYCRQDLCEKIRVLGGFEARPGELFPVAHCAALYLKHVAKITGRCYVIGGQGTLHVAHVATVKTSQCPCTQFLDICTFRTCREFISHGNFYLPVLEDEQTNCEHNCLVALNLFLCRS